MEQFKLPSSESKFSSPEEELTYLRREIERREREILNKTETPNQDTTKDIVKDYKKVESSSILNENFSLAEQEQENIVKNLSPEEHDKTVNQIISMMPEKGIKNILSIVEKMNNPHIEDDIHRYLVQYIAVKPIPNLPTKSPMWRALDRSLYEIVLPSSENKENRLLKEVISNMEQFYAGLLLDENEKEKDNKDYFVFEIANSNGSEEFIFYASVPNSKKSLFEKHLYSLFPDALLSLMPNDHNIFNESGVSFGAYVKDTDTFAFPIKTYESFDHDPLNAILNSFAKINKDGEGACIQVVVKSARGKFTDRYKNMGEKIKKGTDTKEAIKVNRGIGGEVSLIFKELFGKNSNKEKEQKPIEVDANALKLIEEKSSCPVVKTSIRLAVSANTKERAFSILSELQSGFEQFENPKANRLQFLKPEGRELKKFWRNFTFRLSSDSDFVPLNLRELSTVMHFHTERLKGISQLKTTKSGIAPVPIDLLKEGVILGINNYRGIRTEIHISDDDRLRHLYTIGQTGTGKSNLIKQMIIQDIKRGAGVCMIDPHGSDVLDVMSHIPKERLKDVIYFDPSDTQRPMALNMLEYDLKYPEQKTFVVNELFNIFQKLYGAVAESMGPIFEQYFRNSAMLVIEDPSGDSTLLDVSRVLSNKSFRDQKLSKCKNPVVVEFWKEVAEKAGGEASLANIVPYITSKFDVFLANEIMRPIIAQQKSSFNFRDIMDTKKIFLINLSKGRLGDINANLIGLIIIGKILMASLSRVDSLEKNLPPFYLFVDEFHNITTSSIATILSEARKYKLSLTIAHQYIEQLETNIKNAVFGNVGTIVSFRVGTDDAEYLETQFLPIFNKNQIINLNNYHAYVRLLNKGRPVVPFSIETLPIEKTTENLSEEIKKLSREKYGRERELIEAEIAEKYKTIKGSEI